jgi:hypothetical protein
MLIDFESYCGRITDEIFKRMNLDYDPRFTPKAKRVFILQIATFIILFNIYSRVAKLGIDKLVILMAVIFTMSLRLNQKK